MLDAGPTTRAVNSRFYLIRIIARFLVFGFGCFCTVLIVSFIIATLVNPHSSVYDNIFWVLSRQRRADIDFLFIFSSLIISPLIETFIFLLVYRYFAFRKIAFVIIFLASLLLHELSLSSLGKGFAFMLLYFAGKRFMQMIPDRHYLSLYISMASVHAIWNICALAFYAFVLTLSLPPIVPTRF